MKKGGGPKKGGKFERLICCKLSLWWTERRREDVFTRTDASGARATQRSKKNKKTFGQYGDIQAADPIGQPLIDLCPIECKDGYASKSIADLLDKEPRHKPDYLKFIQQARLTKKEAKCPFWLLIARRRGRQIMIYLPEPLWNIIVRAEINHNSIRPTAILNLSKGQHIRALPLSLFFKSVKPEDVVRMSKFYNESRRP